VIEKREIIRTCLDELNDKDNRARDTRARDHLIRIQYMDWLNFVFATAPLVNCDPVIWQTAYLNIVRKLLNIGDFSMDENAEIKISGAIIDLVELLDSE